MLLLSMQSDYTRGEAFDQSSISGALPMPRTSIWHRRYNLPSRKDVTEKQVSRVGNWLKKVCQLLKSGTRAYLRLVLLFPLLTMIVPAMAESLSDRWNL